MAILTPTVAPYGCYSSVASETCRSGLSDLSVIPEPRRASIEGQFAPGRDRNEAYQLVQ